MDLGYQPALDGLRGTAIIVVMAFNGHLFQMRGGFIGVDLFFVLSGFLITSLLLEEHRATSRIGLKNFYFRRALRLLPALFALLLFCAAFALLVQPAEKAATTFNGIAYTLFYVANWAQVSSPTAGIGALSHAWSLSVEEQFYIIWPLVLLMLLRIRSRAHVLASLSAMIVASLVMSMWLWRTDSNYLRIYFGSDTRAHELLIGCGAALLLAWGILPNSGRVRNVLHFLSIVSLAGLLVSCFTVRHYSAFVYNGGFTLISLGAAIIILDFVLFPSVMSRLFEVSPLVWVGRISYGLYLWHFPIFEASRQVLANRMNPFVYAIAKVGAVLLVAAASYYLLERPFLRLKRRYTLVETKATVCSPTVMQVESA